MSWAKTAIKNICMGIYDGPHATPPIARDGAIFLGISNITPDGHLDLSNSKYISEEDFPKWTKRVTPQAGDIVFSYEATLNLYAIIPEGFRGCLGRRMALIRPDEEKVLGKFLYYYFFSDEWRGTIAENTVIGATVDRIPLIRFPDFPVSFPNPEKQKAIANILSAYDNLIENNQKQIKLLEEAAQRLYKEWFVVDDIPKGWEQRSLGDVASVLRRGISPKYDDSGKYLVISQKCIRQSIMDISEARRESKEYEPKLNLQDKDTVICSTGTGTLGRVGQVFGAYPDTTFDSHVTLVRTEQYPNFFYQAIKHQQDFLMGMGRGSTNQQELYRGVIEGLQLLIPTQKILNRAENMLSAIHDKITTLNSQIGLLVEARDRLLPKLMSGEFGGVKNVSLF